MLSSLVLLLALVGAVAGENPAVQVVLSRKGLEFGTHVGAGWIQDQLKKSKIPDMEGNIPLSFLGKIHYKLSGLHLVQLDFPEPTLSFHQDFPGLVASVSGLSASVTGGLEAKFGIIKLRGSVHLALLDLDLTSLLSLGRDVDGHLSITSVSCTSRIRDIDIRFDGRARWITQWMINLMKKWIKTRIEEKICVAVEDATADLERHLKAINVSLEVNEDLVLKLPLTRTPTVDASSLNLGLKGEFLSHRSPQDPPFQAQNFSMSPEPTFMLSVGVSDFILNSATFSLFSDSRLDVNVSDNMIPAASPVHLNTSDMLPFIPQLPEMFPGLLMKLQVFPREFPLFSFEAGSVKLSLRATVRTFVVEPNTTLTPVFTLHLDSQFRGQTWISEERVKGVVSMDNLTLTLVDSGIGPFETHNLEDLTKNTLKSLVLVDLNHALAQGFALPGWDRVRLVHTVVKMKEGFIRVSTDVDVKDHDSHL